MYSIIEVGRSIKTCMDTKRSQGLQRIFDASDAGHALYAKFNEEWIPGKVQFVQGQIDILINCGEAINIYTERRWAALFGERLLGKDHTNGFLDCVVGFKKRDEPGPQDCGFERFDMDAPCLWKLIPELEDMDEPATLPENAPPNEVKAHQLLTAKHKEALNWNNFLLESFLCEGFFKVIKVDGGIVYRIAVAYSERCKQAVEDNILKECFPGVVSASAAINDLCVAIMCGFLDKPINMEMYEAYSRTFGREKGTVSSHLILDVVFSMRQHCKGWVDSEKAVVKCYACEIHHGEDFLKKTATP